MILNLTLTSDNRDFNLNNIMYTLSELAIYYEHFGIMNCRIPVNQIILTSNLQTPKWTMCYVCYFAWDQTDDSASVETERDQLCELMALRLNVVISHTWRAHENKYKETERNE